MISSDSFAITSNVTMCCFGASHIGVPVSIVIAHNCPNIHVSITDLSSNRILPWNEKRLRIHEPKLENMLKKCLNENLIFTTDMRSAIVLADIVLLAVDIPIVHSDDQMILNTREFEEAARIVAKMSESNKIIVQKCTGPLKSLELLKRVLNSNKSKNVNFQVLTMPEFFPSGSAVSYISNPELVLIGRRVCPEGDEAAATVAAIYSHWVPWEKIKIMSDRSVELVRIGMNALRAQRLTSIGALAALCEQSGKNISEIIKTLTEKKSENGQCLVPAFSLGEVNLNWDVLNLVQLSEKMEITVSASYWEEVLKQNNFQEIRFKNKILSAFCNSLNNKKLAVFGLSFKITGEITSESPAINLCAKLLQEGATLSLYDPNIAVDKENVLKAVMECGAGNAENSVTIFENPYGAADKVDGIIFCTDLTEFKSLDYAAIYEAMMKPAHIFDGRNALDHEHLIKIGFIVQAVGETKSIK